MLTAMTTKRILLSAVVVAIVAALSMAVGAMAWGNQAVEVGPNEVLVHENTPNVPNVDPPTVLSVVMNRDDGANDRCNHMGGRLDSHNVCRDVDY